MDIFFTDPTDIPLPPDEVRIRQLEASPWSDGRRISVTLHITPFQKPPSGEISITNALGDELANISIIETVDPKMEFTLHLRGGEVVNPLNVHASLFYPQEISETEETQDNLYNQHQKSIVDQQTIVVNLENPYQP
jgi:hypothetical protein